MVISKTAASLRVTKAVMKMYKGMGGKLYRDPSTLEKFTKGNPGKSLALDFASDNIGAALPKSFSGKPAIIIPRMDQSMGKFLGEMLGRQPKTTNVLLHEAGHHLSSKGMWGAPKKKKYYRSILSGTSGVLRHNETQVKNTFRASVIRESNANRAAVDLIRKFEKPKLVEQTVKDYNVDARNFFKTYQGHLLGQHISPTGLDMGAASKGKLVFTPEYRAEGRGILRKLLRETPELHSRSWMNPKLTHKLKSKL